jgi:hypothetical protein
MHNYAGCQVSDNPPLTRIRRNGENRCMAAMGKLAWADSDFRPSLAPVGATSSLAVHTAHNFAEILEFSTVFRGRELTRKDRRIPCGIVPIDHLIGGGIIRGRISEIVAEPGAGKISLAAAFVARVTQREAAAWIDTSDDFDPASIAAAGVELTRLLWVSSKGAQAVTPAPPAGKLARYNSRFPVASLKAAEWILAAGGFGLVILDFGANVPQLSQSAALRLARGAERCGAGVLVLALRRICGTLAALSLSLRRERACFSRLRPAGPALFEGLRLEACVTRNKMGSSGQTVKWETAMDASGGVQRSRAWNEVEGVSRGWSQPGEALSLVEGKAEGNESTQADS